MFRGSVVYFVVEFCPEVVTAMLFDATASTWEVVLMEGVKRSHIDWCSLKGRRSRCRLKPCLALRVAVVIVMMKSGAARVRGLRIQRPPDASPSWLIRIAEGGIVGWLRREARNVDTMFSM